MTATVAAKAKGTENQEMGNQGMEGGFACELTAGSAD